ncbi:MAG: shikimate dehydrogenase [Candidatus Micrarchaeota archaeon]|nr:shikimate dehydrogenase [Candidatus Micrarchaeota archaeon]
MTEIFAVTGKPILHSKSPQMHNAAFDTLGIDAVYTRLLADNAEEALQTAKEIGITGLNVTAPFKEGFAKLTDELDESANATGMVNTILIEKEKIKGFNTDTVGIIGSFIAHDVKLEEKKVVVLGAGGAAVAAAYTLTAVDAKVTIANRTIENAKKLAKKFNCNFCSLKFSELEKIIPEADIIMSTIGTTERIIPGELLRKNTVILDANYSKKTALIEDALTKGCKIIDGTEWLFFQGLRAFEIFTGKTAPADIMQKAIHKKVPDKNNNIALIGFMGSGKTSVAKEIAKKTKMNIVNVDEDIEKLAGVSIKEIFEKHGEKEFRKMESEELKKIKNAKNSVISCGGGIVLDPNNIELLQQHCTVIWLYVSAETALRRTHGDTSRPLVNVENREEIAKTIVKNRLSIYAKAADLIVNTENRTASQVAELITNEIYQTK